MQNRYPKLFDSSGRSIVENILLAQEIIRDIILRAKHVNVVIKLDMSKANDRLSWLFLTKVLRHFGFCETLIDMVWRLVSNSWYLVLINSNSHGFIRSTRGVKQGDPLSPTLFILDTEVLARSLNSLHDKPQFSGYGLPKWSPHVNPLSYAYYTILFYSVEANSLRMIMKIL
ncbi:secreted RxLR effector protein 78-like [Lycium ferocissimum]|uniref:secreted RxLR effector protein 78-like n=1 Tax=Lycium ferocissimum TaxID=112874 RepID=UPI002815B705|nr:secreted RxLR effector protein 78-like [Lycium ferocissimum]